MKIAEMELHIIYLCQILFTGYGQTTFLCQILFGGHHPVRLALAYYSQLFFVQLIRTIRLVYLWVNYLRKLENNSF